MELICFLPFLLPVPVLAVVIFWEWRKGEVAEKVRVEELRRGKRGAEGERMQEGAGKGGRDKEA